MNPNLPLAIVELTALGTGAYLIGSVHGWQTGVGLAILAFAVMPMRKS